jgi:methyl-accepting chemotaxis protein
MKREDNFKERRRSRRIYLIKRKSQTQFIVRFCLLVIAGALIFGAITYLMSISTVTTSFRNSRLRITSTADFILPALLLSSLVSVVLVGIATIVVTLFTSHKIFGPLYRLEKDVSKVAEGNLKVRFSLRQKDEMKDLVARLNEMIQALRNKVSEIKDTLSEIDSSQLSEGTKEKLSKVKKAVSGFEI